MKSLSDNQSTPIKAKVRTAQKSRIFEYSLNENKSKKKLLKGAKQTSDLLVEVKTGNTNIRLNGGSYYELILPLLMSWYNEVGNIVLIRQTEIEIVDHEVGIECAEKHVDIKVVIMVNSNHLVLHTCNSTQNFMVQGKYHEEFAANVLVPFFEQKIEESRGKIIKLNDNIKATFPHELQEGG